MPNASFGGIGGMAKAGGYEDLEIRACADKLTFDFTFKQLAAGGKNLMSKLPVRIAGGEQVFDLELGKPTNEELGRLETTSEWNCGGPGNLCVSATGAKKCTATCADSTGGTGYTCKAVASSSTNTIYGRACAKTY